MAELDLTPAQAAEEAATPAPAEPRAWYVSLYDVPVLRSETLEEARARRLTGMARGMTVRILVDEHNNLVDIEKVEEF